MNSETIPECTKEPDLWFSRDTGKQRQAVRICERCPLRAACLQMAVETKEEFGTWGGTTEKERAQAFSNEPKEAVLCLNCKNKKPGTFTQVGTKSVGGTRWTNPVLQCGACGYELAISQTRWNRQRLEAA